MTPGQRLIAARMSEDELMRHVRQLCDDLGLAVNHFPDTRRSWLPGFTDLWIAGRRGTGILHAELKRQDGSLSPAQRGVASIIREAGGRWVLWRPGHLLSGEIARTLAGMAAWPTLPLDGVA